MRKGGKRRNWKLNQASEAMWVRDRNFFSLIFYEASECLRRKNFAKSENIDKVKRGWNDSSKDIVFREIEEFTKIMKSPTGSCLIILSSTNGRKWRFKLTFLKLKIFR